MLAAPVKSDYSIDSQVFVGCPNRHVDKPGFGRADTEGVDIPLMSDVQRAREVLDELRRRAGERGRPQDELDYIDRLLRRF